MKVAIVSESPADEAAVLVLLEGLLQQPIEVFSSPTVRGRPGGWSGVLNTIPKVLRHLHYWTDAAALVAVLDSDRSAVHQAAHDAPNAADPACRLCQLRSEVARIRGILRPVEGRQPIKIALGLAVPQVEAWYVTGQDPHVSEAAWLNGLRSGTLPYDSKWLKTKVYRTDRPSLDLETQRAREEAERIVRDGKLPLLERLFQGGFGALAADVRAWRTGQ